MLLENEKLKNNRMRNKQFWQICLVCELIEYQDDEYGAGVIGKVVNVTIEYN